MRVERPIGMNTIMLEKMRRLTSSELKGPGSSTLQTDMQSFEQELERERADDDRSSGDDDPTPFTPFDLLKSLSQSHEPTQEASGYMAVSQAVFDVVQELYACDGRTSRRQVSVVLTEDTLSGVRLSVYEAEDRMVADFMCSVESSRECLCQIAYRLAAELADRLKRDTRVSVRADDPEDPRTLQVDGVPLDDAVMEEAAPMGSRSDSDDRVMKDQSDPGRES